MKKRWLFLLLTGAVLTGVLWMGGSSDPVSVSTVTLTSQRVEQTVSCRGMVETAQTTGVFIPLSCVVERVEVREGSRVKKGDVLAVVDKDATNERLEDLAQRVLLAALDACITAEQDGIVVAVNAQPGVVLEAGVPCVLLAEERDLKRKLHCNHTYRADDLLFLSIYPRIQDTFLPFPLLCIQSCCFLKHSHIQH